MLSIKLLAMTTVLASLSWLPCGQASEACQDCPDAVHVHETEEEHGDLTNPSAAAVYARLTHFDCGWTGLYLVPGYGWQLVRCTGCGFSYWAWVVPG